MGAWDKWKRWLVTFGVALAVLVGWLFAFQTIVDPFGVWGGPVIAGFNNFKSVQDKNERLFKIYEYARIAPEVVFFGSSRVNYCTPAEWPGMEDDKVYNLGINAAHIPEEQRFFEHAIKAHKPRIAAIGLDLLQFSAIYNKPPESFNEERLEMVSRSWLTAWLYKSKETVLSYDAIKLSFDVIGASEKKPDDVYHVRGWDTQRLKAEWPSEFWKFRQQLFRYHTRTYRRYKPAPENFEMFDEMVRFAESQGVKVVLYIHPVHADFLLSYEVNGQWRESERFKRRMAAAGPVWDFNYVNDITRDRRNYQDPSHFQAHVARKIIEVIGNDRPIAGLDFGVRITPSNIDRVLTEQRAAFDEYVRLNPGIRDLLVEARATQNRSQFDRKSIGLIGR